MIEATYKFNEKIPDLIQAIKIACEYNTGLNDSYLMNYIQYIEGTEFINNWDDTKNTMTGCNWDNFHDYIKKYDDLSYGIKIGYTIYKHQKYYIYKTSSNINTFLYCEKTKNMLIKITSKTNSTKSITQRKSYINMTKDGKFKLLKVKTIKKDWLYNY